MPGMTRTAQKDIHVDEVRLDRQTRAGWHRVSRVHAVRARRIRGRARGGAAGCGGDSRSRLPRSRVPRSREYRPGRRRNEPGVSRAVACLPSPCPPRVSPVYPTAIAPADYNFATDVRGEYVAATLFAHCSVREALAPESVGRRVRIEGWVRTKRTS